MLTRIGVAIMDLPRPVLYGFTLILIVITAFGIGRCTGKDRYENDRVAAQADQTETSSDAIAQAANDAIDTLENRTATEDAVDQAVEQAVTEIENAANADEVRAAVLAGACGSAEHRNDPACVGNAESRE